MGNVITCLFLTLLMVSCFDSSDRPPVCDTQYPLEVLELGGCGSYGGCGVLLEGGIYAYVNAPVKGEQLVRCVKRYKNEDVVYYTRKSDAK